MERSDVARAFDTFIKICLIGTILLQSHAIHYMGTSIKNLLSADQRLKQADDDLKAADARLKQAIGWCQGEWH